MFEQSHKGRSNGWLLKGSSNETEEGHKHFHGSRMDAQWLATSRHVTDAFCCKFYWALPLSPLFPWSLKQCSMVTWGRSMAEWFTGGRRQLPLVGDDGTDEVQCKPSSQIARMNNQMIWKGEHRLPNARHLFLPTIYISNVEDFPRVSSHH